MTCSAAVDHLFCATRLAPIVSLAVVDRGRFSVMQGNLDPLLLQWLQTDLYWAVIMNRLGDQSCSKRPRRIFEEGGYTTGDGKLLLCSTLCALDYINPLGLRSRVQEGERRVAAVSWGAVPRKLAWSTCGRSGLPMRGSLLRKMLNGDGFLARPHPGFQSERSPRLR